MNPDHSVESNNPRASRSGEGAKIKYNFDSSEDEIENDDYGDENNSHVLNKKRKASSSSNKKNLRKRDGKQEDDFSNDECEDDDVDDSSGILRETGQILRIEVENFMCHRKFCKF